jgi:type IV pilus assembly protein PilA
MAILSKIRKSRGFTLVELMIVVVIIGILAALAIYGVRKYVSNSKSAEARLAIGAISKGAVTAYEGESMSGSLLALAGTVGSSRRLCDSTANTVPAAVTTIGGGKKYQSSAAEWSTGSQNVGWQCLKFSLTGPQYFMYNYTATNPAATNGTYAASATADFDGDNTAFASFTLNAAIDATTGTLRVSPAIVEANPDE